MDWSKRLMGAGAFMAIFAGYLFSKGPAVNSQQFGFRVGLLAVGVVLGIAGLVLGARGQRRQVN